MAGARVLGKGGDADARPVAVIDIGSNSVRLVVYEGSGRAPLPIFNEKVLCGLARGMAASGRLSEDGMALALDSLRRFAALTRAMGVRRVDAVATAAVRDTANGAAFVAEIKRCCGLDVTVLSGNREARLSALGVLSGTPEAAGLMGDLGGGSVELVALDKGKLGVHETLPLGPLRLADAGGIPLAAARRIVDEKLAGLTWLRAMRGKTFYAVGGAWRLLARIHMRQNQYPLRIIHHYTIPGHEAVDFARFVAGLSRSTLEKIPEISKRRLDAVPYAALLLQRILQETGARSLVFSAYGLREGCLYNRLSAAGQRADPLLAICRGVAARAGRVTADGEVLHRWIEPIIDADAAAMQRLRHAACHLADIAWSEHPDYRGEHAFLRILRLPMVGIDHPGRVFMALAVASRHAAVDPEIVRSYTDNLLDEAQIRQAQVTGLAMRLGYTVSGGVTALLKDIALRRNGDRLQLAPPPQADILIGDAVQRRLRSLARALGCEAEIVPPAPAAASA